MFLRASRSELGFCARTSSISGLYFPAAQNRSRARVNLRLIHIAERLNGPFSRYRCDRDPDFDYFLSRLLCAHDFSHTATPLSISSPPPHYLSLVFTQLVRMRQHEFTRGYTCTLYASARCLSTSAHIPHKRLSDVVVIARRADHRYTTWRKNKGPHHGCYMCVCRCISKAHSSNLLYTQAREWTTVLRIIFAKFERRNRIAREPRSRTVFRALIRANQMRKEDTDGTHSYETHCS